MDTGYGCNNHVYQRKGGRISINLKKNLKREVTHIQIHHHYVGRPNKERIHKICFCDIGSVNCLFHRSLIDNWLFATLKIACLENAFDFEPLFYHISLQVLDCLKFLNWFWLENQIRAFGIHRYLSMVQVRNHQNRVFYMIPIVAIKIIYYS